jgi:hypothetical protein
MLQQSCDDVFGVPTEINLVGINLPKKRMEPSRQSAFSM